MAHYADYKACVAFQKAIEPEYSDYMKFALRNYSCWCFAFTICKDNKNLTGLVYFMILYKPFSLLYKLSGLLMLGLILAGYGITIANMIFTSKSVCKSTTALGKLSNANAIIFLIVASLTLAASHTLFWLPYCRGWCKKDPSLEQVRPVNGPSQPMIALNDQSDINQTTVRMLDQTQALSDKH